MKTIRLSVQLIVIVGLNIILHWDKNGIGPKSTGNGRGGPWITVVKLKVENASVSIGWEKENMTIFNTTNLFMTCTQRAG